jgi:hypothetical protein
VSVRIAFEARMITRSIPDLKPLCQKVVFVVAIQLRREMLLAKERLAYSNFLRIVLLLRPRLHS